MARDTRLRIYGGIFHVTNRGNRKGLIYEDERDRNRFIQILIETAAEYHVVILADTQMGNHFHLIVLTPHGNLSEFMQQLEGRYAQYSNWRHGRVGHLFQDRFVAVVIENDIHLFTAAWYVFSNPVKACFVARPEDWRWSTYAATVGLAPVPEYLSISWIETLFPADSLQGSQAMLRQCMSDSQPIQAFLQAVDPTMPDSIRSYIAERLHDVPQPCTYGRLLRPPIEHLFPISQTIEERATAILLAHDTHGYKLSEIARTLEVHPSTVSRLRRRALAGSRAISGSDPEIAGSGVAERGIATGVPCRAR